MESVSSKGMYVCETNGRPIRKHIYVLGRLVSTVELGNKELFGYPKIVP